jgi:hypothetical protein
LPNWRNLTKKTKNFDNGTENWSKQRKNFDGDCKNLKMFKIKLSQQLPLSIIVVEAMMTKLQHPRHLVGKEEDS